MVWTGAATEATCFLIQAVEGQENFPPTCDVQSFGLENANVMIRLNLFVSQPQVKKRDYFESYRLRFSLGTGVGMNRLALKRELVLEK